MNPRTPGIDRKFGRALRDLDDTARGNLRTLLRSVRYEIYPDDSIVERVIARFPPRSVPFAVTSSVSRPISAMVDVVSALAGAGFEVMPHLPARQFATRTEVEDTLRRLRRKGVDRALVLGGDATDPGPFPAAIDLLRHLDKLGKESGERFGRLGIAGHPEGNPRDPAATRALLEKQPYADFVVTQLSFDAERIGRWLGELRLRHFDLPADLSVPGVVSIQRLRRMADALGVGDSRSALPSHGEYSPGGLVMALSQLPLEKLAVAGLHVATFNEVEAVESWRQRAFDAASRTER